ncbi:MAG TPA: hypothetical protein ENO14_01505 [Chromatiales bacterium]|nr:hypothetical protein [Chromatiales bacterium]
MGTIKRIMKIGAISIVAFLSLVAIFLGAFIWWSSVGVFSTQTFDSSRWHAPISDERDVTCYRGGMANYIREHLLKVGESKQFVEKLLGKPDFVTESEYRYILGMCSGLGLDYDDLHVYFDGDGRITHAAIIQH